jgi:iron uptake system EfeUOB component EfeO/EfeM
MKTIKFEDALKDYLEEMKRTGRYTKAYKAFVEANILKLVMERRPVVDSNATMMDLFDATEMTEFVRETEAMTEAFMKSEIERMAREFYHRLRQIC